VSFPPRLQAGPRGHRVEAPWLALPLRPLTALDQEQESSSTDGQARSGGGLGTVKRQGTILVLFFGLFTFLVLALAQWGSGSSCGWQFPKWFGCVLQDHESLAAGLIGAAGALFAAWIAWTAVQRQLEEQQRQVRIVERAYISGGGGYRIHIGDDGVQ